MFKDTQKELQRLQEQLLQEEAQEQGNAPLSEDFEDFDEEIPDVYRNYANNYRAYNSDTSDNDLEAVSEEVRNPSRRQNFRSLCLMALLAGILAILIGWALHILGG